MPLEEGLVLMQRERKGERETWWARESSLIQLLFLEGLLCVQELAIKP